MVDGNNVGIENDLKANEEKLEFIKAKVEESSKQQQELSKYVADLKKYFGETKQIGMTYEKVFAEREDFDKFAKKTTLEDEVKDSKDVIEEVKKRNETANGVSEDQIQASQDRQASLNDRLTRSKTEVEKAQKEYEELKLKIVDPNLKVIRERKSAVERELQEENKLAAYNIFQKMKKDLENMKLKDPTEFTRDLEGAAKKLADATKEFRSTSIELEKAKAELEDAKKKDAKCQEDINADLRKMKPQQRTKSLPSSKQPGQSKQSSQSATAS